MAGRSMDYLKYDGWKIRFEGFPEEKDASVPTLLSIGNGSVGMRGTVPELESREEKGVYAAGFFDRLPRPDLDYNSFSPFYKAWTYKEKTKRYQLEEALVNCPDILAGYFEADGERFDLDVDDINEMTRELDMRTGEAVFTIPVRTRSGKKAVVRRRRFISMKRQEAYFESASLKSKNFSGEVSYHPYIDIHTANFNLSGVYKDIFSKEEGFYYTLYDLAEREDKDFYTVVRGRCFGYKLYITGCMNGQIQNAGVQPGETVSVRRSGIVMCDRIQPVDKTVVMDKTDQIRDMSYDDALAENRAAWNELWDACDIRIDGDLKTQTGIRHNLYLLNISFCRISDKASVAAKGLTGEGYRGMVFWDTDIHMFPFYLYTQPEAARNIVSFRYQTLDGARKKAEEYGCRGASYPWETGTTGNEECESFLMLITNQIHITSDVAYAAAKYLQAVNDEAFYLEEAAEIFIETARFWISRGKMIDGKFCILHACGPDELHIDSDDNAYVMNMARYNLDLAADAISTLQADHPDKWKEIETKIGITEEEIRKISEYRACIKTMKGENGLFEQCEGYFSLIDKTVGGDDPELIPAQTQTLKQADLLMLLYLLPELVTKEELLANWDYYEPRTTHTSSLSFGVHGILASHLGLKEKAEYYLNRSMGLDLFEPKSNCEDGAHLAAAGMSWSAVVNGIGGISFEEDGISLSPVLPEKWSRLSFRLNYQGKKLGFVFGTDGFEVTNDITSSDTAAVYYRGQKYLIARGEHICF